MKKWPLFLTAALMLGLYGVFLAFWFSPREAPAAPTTEATTTVTTLPATEPTTQATTEPTTEPTTEATTEATTEPATVPTTEPLPAPPDESVLNASTVFVYDLTAERMLYTLGDQNQTLAPASLTKLMTTLIVLEHLKPETVVEAGPEASWVAAGSSVAAINYGNRLTVEMLLEGMLTQSGNDAAYVLAVAAGRAIAGNEALSAEDALAAFLEEAKSKCEELGLEGSCFLNPDGYDTEGHYSSPADLLKLACLVSREPLARKYMTVEREHVVFASGQDYIWENTNLLVRTNSQYYCKDAFGLKTGSTDNAGYCLIAGFERDGRTLIIGVLGCSAPMHRFEDALYLYEHFINQ